jgi:hypothetical protein
MSDAAAFIEDCLIIGLVGCAVLIAINGIGIRRKP